MTKPFLHSYSDYLNLIESSIFSGIKICEIGPSGHPSIKSSVIKERGLDYSIIDIETTYWDDYNPEVKKYNIDLQTDFDNRLEGQFDLVISQMVLEHIEYPENLHKGIYRLLKKGGSAIHLYANPYSLSAMMNKFLPESIGEFVLDTIKNRNLDKNHKYPAYYRWCFTPSNAAKKEFESIGYKVDNHIAYLGHNYFRSIPIMNMLEELYSWKLSVVGFKLLSTLSLLHVRK